MHALRYALQAALAGDTLSSPVDAAVSATQVDLTAGEFAKWAVGDSLYIDEAASAAHLEVVRITAASANRLTFDHALAAAPTTAATLKAGLAELTVANGLRYHKPRYSAPVDGLLDGDSELACLLFGMASKRQAFGSADVETWELRAISRSTEFAELAAERMRRLFLGKRSALAPGAMYVDRLDAGTVVERTRDDELAEFMVSLEAWVAERVA